MSYALYDSEGPLDEFASIGGYADFRSWAVGQKGVLRAFAQKGFTEDFEELEKALVDAEVPEEISEQRDLLLQHLKDAKDILIISDGMSDPEGGLKPLRSLAARPEAETAMHAAADANLKKASRAISLAIRNARNAVSKSSIEVALSLQSKKAIAQAVSPLASRLEDELTVLLPKVLAMGLREGGQTGLRLLKKRAKIRAAAKDTGPYTTMAFNEKNEDVIKWAKEHSAESIKNITETTRKRIADAIVRMFEKDIPLNEAYDDIVDAVGDDARGMNIARSELMMAANEGQRQAWNQAVETGLLDRSVKRTSIATLGACKYCEGMDSQTAELGEPYEPIDVDGEEFEPGMGPPYHNMCRCTEGLTA